MTRHVLISASTFGFVATLAGPTALARTSRPPMRDEARVCAGARPASVPQEGDLR